MKLIQLKNTAPWEWPEDAGEVFSDVLSDKSASLSDRVMAAELVSSEVVMDDEMASLLLAIIRDGEEEDELRSQAAISLGPALEYGDTMEFDDPEDIILTEEGYETVKAGLHEAFESPDNSKELRRRILEASVRAPMSWHTKAIKEAYESGDQEWLLTAVFGMQYVQGFDKQILECLRHKNQDIVGEAVSASGNWEIKKAWPVIMNIMSDEEAEKWLLVTAIEAAPYVNRLESKPFLDFFFESDDEDIADAAEEAALAAKFLESEGMESMDDFDDY